MLAGTQFLSFGEYVLYKGNSDTYNINSTEPIEVFYNLRVDLDKLQYAAYIAKIVEDVTNENDSSYKILQLILNTIYVISENDDIDKDLVVATFKIRLLSIIGFTPNVISCVSCGARDKLSYFSIRDDGIKCDTCCKLDKSAIRISSGTLYALRYIVMCEAKKIFSFSIPEICKEEVKLIAKVYLNEKLEKNYKFDKII